jgi:hypothetical protein
MISVKTSDPAIERNPSGKSISLALLEMRERTG